MEKLSDFSNSLNRLEEALKVDKSDISRDSAIKRFELAFDLAWKCIKEFSKDQGLECYSPRDCFKTAFELKLIDHDEKWLEMIQSRNESVHLYNEKGAENLFSKLPEFLNLLKGLNKNLKSRY